MADFLTAYKKTAVVEGGYANDKDDTGRETWKGVARKKNPNWKGWAIVDSLRNHPQFPKILYENTGLQYWVEKIYRDNYWNPIRGDEIKSQDEANAIYDSAVNMGVGAAVKLAQKALALPESGRMNNATLDKLNNKS